VGGLLSSFWRDHFWTPTFYLQTKMDKPQIVKFKAGKNTFEVLTKTGTVLKFRKGQLGSLDNVLLADEVSPRILTNSLTFFNLIIRYSKTTTKENVRAQLN